MLGDTAGVATIRSTTALHLHDRMPRVAQVGWPRCRRDGVTFVPPPTSPVRGERSRQVKPSTLYTGPSGHSCWQTAMAAPTLRSGLPRPG